MLIAVAVLLGFLLVARAVSGWYVGYQEELDLGIARKTAQYEKLLRLQDRSREYAQVSDSLDQFIQDMKEKRFIVAASPALAEVTFQNLIKELAAKSNINIRAVKAMPMTAEGDLSFLNLTINSRAEIGGIKDFLAALQNLEKHLYCRQVEIKRINNRENRFFYFNAKIAALTQQ